MSADGFSPTPPSNSGSGPNSNTGQKSIESHGALVDFLTVVIPADRLVECSATNIHCLLPMIFGTREELKCTGIQSRGWNFYEKSASIFDHNGELCGKIGLGGNKETVCVSLTGEGCRWVQNWHYVAHQLEVFQAKITRIDLAYDDYDGELMKLDALREMAKAGEGFNSGGRPPSSRFMDDHGSGKGCTLYVGQKGHKELCVYEKGKEKGDVTSPWIRAEVRFYGKHIEAMSFEMLTKPLQYLRGAYPVLSALLPGICSRAATVARTVEASGRAMVSWLKNQIGPSMHLLVQAVGIEKFGQFLIENVTRDKRPARFARCGVAPGYLPHYLRQQLCISK